jgi:pimeloyl-ACP methyl ester carboxylesterase
MIKAVKITTRDGTVLRGQLQAGGPDLAVCVHAHGRDLDVWQKVAAELASDGLSVLAYDLAGHGGSDGEPDRERAGRDLVDVVGCAAAPYPGRLFLLSDGDASQATLSVAAVREPAGLVLLSPSSLQGLQVVAALPKLLVLGADNPLEEEAALADGELAGYSLVIRLPVRGSLLEGSWNTTIVDYIVRFLREARVRSPMKEVRK